MQTLDDIHSQFCYDVEEIFESNNEHHNIVLESAEHALEYAMNLEKKSCSTPCNVMISHIKNSDVFVKRLKPWLESSINLDRLIELIQQDAKEKKICYSIEKIGG